MRALAWYSKIVVVILSAMVSVAGCGGDEGTGQASDGDGDTTGDGDGDTATGDGDGDTATGDGDGDPASGWTYWKDAKAILDANCVNCHTEGGIGPFALDSWEQAQAFAPVLAPAIEDRSMPPWQAAPGCTTYLHDRSLAEDERQLLLDWIADGYPEGDPADAPPDPEPPGPFVADLSLQIPEPYTPTQEPDDYRCFIVPWPEDMTEPVYVTGQSYIPGQPQIVHHIISFVADAQDADFFYGLDEAEPGPGYTCFGTPGAIDWSARWIGNWVPGSVEPWQAPEGTGIEIRPGSILIVQVHYNTLAGRSVADQSTLEFQLADAVDRPGTFIPILDIDWLLGVSDMTIPAGESEVHHSVSIPRDDVLFAVTMGEIGAGTTTEVDIWRAGLHMHYLGTQASVAIQSGGGGGEQCLVRIDDWDFNWQQDYRLADPVSFGPGDSMELDCWYDNSAANQPIIDGEPKVPATVGWGDGTLDEMCLAIVYAALQ